MRTKDTHRLSRGFFARQTLIVAQALLGQRLVRELDGIRLSGRVVEVEAYIGEDDQACHARPGLTKRNAPMYGLPGHAYVYLIYGMHHCLNVVTEREGFPAAVLVRALEPLEGIEKMRELRGGRPDLSQAGHTSHHHLRRLGRRRLSGSVQSPFLHRRVQRSPGRELRQSGTPEARTL